ncbi:cupin domain-containing protein [Actinoplanes sp. L3-i22]|uniref:cupin domain-containing protein n=1 Tax=Actinoplanes sp. L3-i22 TaxID=2836373 RepID=UPI001C860A0D|nr:cupin domain-containing protein [Actinoplanes sp. L3-i22]
MLFDKGTVAEMMTDWPAKPAVHEIPPDSVFSNIINAKLLNTYLDTGCAPADEINVVREGAARHPRAYAPAGTLDPSRVSTLRARGYSFQLRNLDRWYPPLHAMCRAIQRETGYGCYVTGFVTPGGAQGLDYHWDQNMGLVCQLSGSKTWEIWHPVVADPHRDFKASNLEPLDQLVKQLKADGPDQVIELKAGQVLVLPRGWVHNPHARHQATESTHLTFVMRERTGFWIGQKLVKAAIESAPLRNIIAPAGVVDEEAFTSAVEQARDQLVGWLGKVDARAMAAELLAVATSELEPDYV